MRNLTKQVLTLLCVAQVVGMCEGFLQHPPLTRPVALPTKSKPLFSTADTSKLLSNSETRPDFSTVDASKFLSQKHSKKNNLKALAALGSGGAILNLLLRGRPFAFTAFPYILCLVWGLPSSNVGSRKSIISIAHRLGGISTLVLPLILACYNSVTGGLFPSLPLYIATVATAVANLSFGGALIVRRVPGYDIPTLRAFAVGVSLGFAFLGHSLLFVLGKYPWYRPVGWVMAAVAVYSTIFAWSDALQHAWNFLFSDQSNNLTTTRTTTNATTKSLQQFWKLPFEKPKPVDVFLKNIWRRPTPEALDTTVSPANLVVVMTTGMTAVFASLSLLQLRYLALGPAGMMKLSKLAPAFCHWSALQGLLAVVANNFGTFSGTLVIQRRVSQNEAGIFNALGLLVPVLNIAAFLLVSSQMAIDDFVRLIRLPAIP